MRGPSQVQSPELWDIVVRATHWALAVLILVNAAITEGGSTLHVWLGWIGGAILLVRLGWGIFGTPAARFSAFPPSPRAALSHLRELMRGQPRGYPSHNPAGAMMVYGLWACLAGVIVTGLILTGGTTPVEYAARQAAVAAGDWSVVANVGGLGRQTLHLVKEVHEALVNLMLAMALFHVAGVAAESYAMKRNLVLPMIARIERPPRSPQHRWKARM